MLCDLFEAENAALRAHNIAKVREGATRKENLIRFYIELMTDVAGHTDILKTFEEPQRVHLKARAEQLHRRPAWKPTVVFWRPIWMPATG